MHSESGYRVLLKELIAFPTVSTASNLALIEFAETFLAEHGFETERIQDDQGDKANLIARIGPDVSGGIALAGHTDVVPVSGQDWQHDPFEMTEKLHHLYGRGTSDMKGFIALAMEAAASVDAARLKKPLYLLLTYDEEIGCLGAMALQEKLKDLAVKPRFVLIGEPTGMQLVSAHKGIQQMVTRVRGKPAHSSRPDLGASAIEFAARYISRIGEMLPAERDEAFHPPLTTFNVGLIKGGEAVNITPEFCELQWEFRHLPQQEPERIRRKLERMSDDIRLQMPGVSAQSRVAAAVPALLAGDNRQIVEHLRQYIEPPEPAVTTAPFVTEGGIYQQAGIPAVICGPGLLEQAHQPNEHVSLQAMHDYRDFLLHLIANELMK
jgi:acetylornithine deacetylase